MISAKIKLSAAAAIAIPERQENLSGWQVWYGKLVNKIANSLARYISTIILPIFINV